ncbi:ferrochelatase [Helcobacillus massiliensis]|uniref:ferrochelatase n=1 Tax=Helcobacillus massiliensis TaxID=521392 RepID=UPI0021A51262|nr:ferrochelatase [Helcobacillus massiliensis]MCT1556662.1 ferrochelatase [Helcobacillus massiliensis]MCT2035856.1 ferrochelatase [Helcobacillus massiliensis]MCT2331062.1 ferrochelatase [Helcobacillus massiliensis]
MSAPIDSILFASFGGPETLDDVMPFLRNVTRGRGIPDERLEEVSHHYRALGGKSPINDQNKDLIARLEKALAARGIDLPVYWGNRNWEPYVNDTVKQMHADGHRHALGLVTSAYSSYSSCRQYREDFGLALQANDLKGEFEISKARVYFNHPGFLDPVVDSVRGAIADLEADGHERSAIDVLFSTHSIPNTMADTSGPRDTWEEGSGGWYVKQHQAAIDYVIEKAGASDVPHQLVYQSRSGPAHIPWLEPDINDVIDGLEGRTAVIVVPIGFVTDHVEVVWDLDTEAKETAEEKGLAFIRVPTSGSSDRFVEALVDLVEERISGAEPTIAVGGDIQCGDVCGAGCCPNARAIQPTTSGVDSEEDWEKAGEPSELALMIRAKREGAGR